MFSHIMTPLSERWVMRGFTSSTLSRYLGLATILLLFNFLLIMLYVVIIDVFIIQVIIKINIFLSRNFRRHTCTYLLANSFSTIRSLVYRIKIISYIIIFFFIICECQPCCMYMTSNIRSNYCEFKCLKHSVRKYVLFSCEIEHLQKLQSRSYNTDI